MPEGLSRLTVQERLGLDFVDLGHGNGAKRYRKGAAAFGYAIAVWWDNTKEGVGVHVDISGEGMRFLEAQEGFPGWPEWIRSWLQLGARFSRTDLAVDDLSGRITFEQVIEALSRRDVATKVEKYKIHQGLHEIGSAVSEGRTVEIGNRKSETFMRGYEKGLEMAHKAGKVIDHAEGGSPAASETPSNWMRFECEFKRERAHAVAVLISAGDWDAAVGAIRSFIDFKDPEHLVVNQTQRRSASWWAELLEASRHRLAVGEFVASVVESAETYADQALATIAALVIRRGGDISWLEEGLGNAVARFKPKHWLIANAPCAPPRGVDALSGGRRRNWAALSAGLAGATG